MSEDVHVMYQGRKAVLTSFYDAVCLLFPLADGKPDFPEEQLLRYEQHFPGMYVVYLRNLSVKDRMTIKKEDGRPLYETCICETYGAGDMPKRLVQEAAVALVGEDLLAREYSKGEFFDCQAATRVRCLFCGKTYQVTLQMGYRSPFHVWTEI